MSRQAFTTCSTLALNCVLYQESGLINLWGAGNYYDGTTCWVVNSSGVITGTSNCVPTIYYYNVTKFNHPACNIHTSNLTASSIYSIPLNLYYNISDGYRYYTEYVTGAAFADVDLSYASLDIDCST